MEFNIDPETFRLFQTGDPHAYREIRDVLREPVYLLCKKRLRDSSLAYTATEYILEKIRKHAKKIKVMEAYLTTTINTTCIDMAKRKRREEGKGRYIPVGEESDFNELTTNEWERVLIMKEAYKDLMQEVERLPEDLREMFLLRHKEELTVKEIVEATQIPRATVYRRLEEALEWLRGRVKKIYQN